MRERFRKVRACRSGRHPNARAGHRQSDSRWFSSPSSRPAWNRTRRAPNAAGNSSRSGTSQLCTRRRPTGGGKDRRRASPHPSRETHRPPSQHRIVRLRYVKTAAMVEAPRGFWFPGLRAVSISSMVANAGANSRTTADVIAGVELAPDVTSSPRSRASRSRAPIPSTNSRPSARSR
jgi:hypothetical protein